MKAFTYEELKVLYEEEKETFSSIIKDMSDITIDELLEFHQEMPDDMRCMIVDIQCSR